MLCYGMTRTRHSGRLPTIRKSCLPTPRHTFSPLPHTAPPHLRRRLRQLMNLSLRHLSLHVRGPIQMGLLRWECKVTACKHAPSWLYMKSKVGRTHVGQKASSLYQDAGPVTTHTCCQAVHIRQGLLCKLYLPIYASLSLSRSLVPALFACGSTSLLILSV